MMSQTPGKTCDELAELISAYFDQQLDPEGMRMVEEHVGNCAHCRRRLDEYQQIGAAIASQQKAQPPVDLAAGVMEKIEREQLLAGMETLVEAPTHRAARLLKGLAIAAMICFVVTAGFVVTMQGRWPSRSKLTRLFAEEEKAGVEPAASDDANRTKSNVSGDDASLDDSRGRLSEGLAKSRSEDRAGQEVGEGVHIAKPAGIGVKPTTDTESTRLVSKGLDRFEKKDNATFRLVPSMLRRVVTQPASGLEAPDVVVRVQDAATWMYMRNRLIGVFQGAGLTELGSSVSSTQPSQKQREFYCVLPSDLSKSEQGLRCRLVVNAGRETVVELAAAIGQIPSQLASITGPVALDVLEMPASMPVNDEAAEQTDGEADASFSFGVNAARRFERRSAGSGKAMRGKDIKAGDSAGISKLVVELAIEPTSTAPVTTSACSSATTSTCPSPTTGEAVREME